MHMKRILFITFGWLGVCLLTPGLMESAARATNGIVGADHIAPPRNLALNPSAEEIIDGRPKHWRLNVLVQSRAEWGVTEDEKRSGRYAAYLRALEYGTSQQPGLRRIAAGILTAGEKSMAVNPSTMYQFSIWLKTDLPRVSFRCYGWNEAGERLNLRVAPRHGAQIKSGEWTRYEGHFITTAQTRYAALGIYVDGLDKASKRFGAPIPLNVPVYIDDLEIFEGERSDSVEAMIERITLRPENIAWQPGSGQPPAMQRLMPGTPVPMDEIAREYLNFPVYKGLPDGWQRIDLNGVWKIRRLENTVKNPVNDPGTTDGYWRDDYDDTSWAERSVPGNWFNEDKVNSVQDAGSRSRKYWAPPEGAIYFGVGWWRKRVLIPKDSSNTRVLLCFEGVNYKTTLWVNGQEIGRHTGGLMPFKFDITDVVRFGVENTIALRVFVPDDEDDPVYPFLLGGIWGNCHLDLVPQLYAQRMLINPRLSDQSIELDGWFLNGAGQARDCELKARVRSYPTPFSKGPLCDTTIALGQTKFNPGLNRRQFKVPLANPVYWSHENPYLYEILLLADNKVVGMERFGFRSFQADGVDLKLNGVKVRLFGVYGEQFNYLPEIAVTDRHRLLKKTLLSARAHNKNYYYPTAKPLPRIFYRYFDEMGLLVYDEWAAAHHWYPRNLPVESEPDLGEVDLWVYTRYNHPSVVMFSLGGELFESQRPKYIKAYDDVLAPLYSRLKELDQQGRPVSPSSGRILYPTSKTDLFDEHAYPGSLGHCWTDETAQLLEFMKRCLVAQGGQEKPLIQTEAGGFLRFYNSDAKAVQKAGMTAQSDFNKAEFIRLAKRAKGVGVGWVSGIYGLRRYLRDLEIYERYGVGWGKQLTKNQTEDFRRCGLISAFMANLDRLTMTDVLVEGKLSSERAQFSRSRREAIYKDIDNVEFVIGDLFEDLRRSFNPKFICLNVFARNCFAGGELAADVYVMNDTLSELPPVLVRAVIRHPNGEVLRDLCAETEPIPPAFRAIFPFACRLPDDLPTGRYRIELFLVESGKVVADNDYEFYVVGAADLAQKLETTRRVALYDRRAKFIDPRRMTTARILDQLGLAYRALDSFEGLTDYDVLIIGAHAFDQTIEDSGVKIRHWIEAGGRLLQFEQNSKGALPWAPQLQIVQGYAMTVSDPIFISHPAFKGLDAENFYLWNGELPGGSRPARIFRCALRPLNETVVATGAINIPRSSSALAMTIADIKIGAGQATVNQLEATFRYGRDSAATRYVQNLLQYVLSDETRYATALPGFVLPTINPRECAWADLGRLGNTKYGKGAASWLDGMAAGRTEYKGIPFLIPAKAAALCMGEKLVVKTGDIVLFDPQAEEKFCRENVDMGTLQTNQIEQLFVLYGAERTEAHGKAAARFTLRFDDGKQAVFHVKPGESLAAARSPAVELAMAVKLTNGLCLTAWDNPESDKKIAAIEITSLANEPFVVIGVTAKLTRPAFLHSGGQQNEDE